MLCEGRQDCAAVNEARNLARVVRPLPDFSEAAADAANGAIAKYSIESGRQDADAAIKTVAVSDVCRFLAPYFSRPFGSSTPLVPPSNGLPTVT